MAKTTEKTAVKSKRKRPAKASVQQRIECFKDALSDLNPKFKKTL